MADAGHDDRARAQPQQAHRNTKGRRPNHVLRHLAQRLSEIRIDDRHGEMPHAESKTGPDDGFAGVNPARAQLPHNAPRKKPSSVISASTNVTRKFNDRRLKTVVAE